MRVSSIVHDRKLEDALIMNFSRTGIFAHVAVRVQGFVN